jgi:excisionase family DNA binding protein
LRDYFFYGRKSRMNLLNTQQAAEKLGIDPSRVRRLILDGRLPAQKIGRDHLINEEDLALVAERKPGRPPKIEGEQPAQAHAPPVDKPAKKRAAQKTTKKRATKKPG